MDVELPVLAGFLNVPTQSGFSINRISKKKSCQRYCLLFKSSRHGIERLELCESMEDKNPKIITLENCVKITQEPAPANLIQIVKKTETLTLNTLTDNDLKEWLNALQTVAFREKVGLIDRNVAIEEDNDLYCSSYGDGLFIVTLVPSETSIRCSLEPKAYMLHLTATELQLKSSEDLNIIIVNWPYRYIRKYGYREGKFTFEAGRKCNTGEGVFILDHTNPQEVFRCMSSKMKSMKKLISGESLNNIDCGENQLSAALSMEAGSRSPLPPSPSNQNPNDFEINSSHSCISIRGFLSSSDSLNNVSFNSNTNTNNTSNIPTSASKNIPNKPPRKPMGLTEKQPLQTPLATSSSILSATLATTTPLGETKSCSQQNCDKFKKFQNYEPVSITTTIDPNRTVGSAVVLKPPSPELVKSVHSNIISHNSSNLQCIPPDLPLRNESTKQSTERDYEYIETITDAWKTLGLDEVKHTERTQVSNEDIVNCVWLRTQSHRDKNTGKEISTKMIEIDIDKSNVVSNYDRLDFLSPKNNASSGYKTIVNVTSANARKKSSPPVPDDYELIASPDIEPCRIADDSYLGYGVLRKPCTPGPQVANASSKNITNISTTLLNDSANVLDHRNYNGLNYTVVSKPKRV